MADKHRHKVLWSFPSHTVLPEPRQECLNLVLQAVFLSVYIDEAHPADGWALQCNDEDGVCFMRPETLNQVGLALFPTSAITSLTSLNHAACCPGAPS